MLLNESTGIEFVSVGTALWLRCNPMHKWRLVQVKAVQISSAAVDDDEDGDEDFGKHNLVLGLLEDCGPKVWFL